jgi:RND family efflux transporter MFP subunit
MKRIVVLLALVAAACRDRPQSDAAAPSNDATENDRPDLSFTDWEGNSELFIELPALVAGLESPCAAHVTRLEPFSALASGRVTVVLRGPGGDERFDADAPSVAGIFRPIAVPNHAGTRRLLVEIVADDLAVTHDLGEVVVFADLAAARSSITDEPEAAARIVFLKEQQWVIDFGTSPVQPRSLRPTLRATGRVVARSDGEVEVTAPVAGRISSGVDGFPRLGDRVAVDDMLAVLAPRLEAADLASLDLAVTSSTLEVRFAQRERERLEALRKEGAIPERRVLDALHAEEEAKAALGGAQRRLGQFRRVQRTAGKGEGSVKLRSPLSGTITAIDVAPGAFVEAGAAVLRVTDMTQLWLEARVPEADAGRLAQPLGAWALAEGYDTPLELGAEALVARGSTIEPDRTLRVVFGFDNTALRLPVGAFTRVLLTTGDDRTALAVPESAIVDDGGTPVVYVQVEGEAFERRVVRTGLVDRGWVEIESGVLADEHVVTTGAWSVKLASSSGTLPAHGHAH